MIKKIITAVIALVLVLPIVVNADALQTNTYYNRNLVAGSELEINIPISLDREFNFVFEYDPEFFSITENAIGREFTKPTDYKNENGKLSFKYKVETPQIQLDPIQPYLNMRFNVLKSGNTTIKNLTSGLITSTELTFSIKEAKCPPAAGQNAQITPSEETAPTPEEPTEPVNPDETETIIPLKDEKQDKTKELIFYASLGANAFLFIALIVSLITRKKNKPVEPVKPEEPEKPEVPNNSEESTN